MIATTLLHLHAALEAHFHPDTGTPFWLDRERELGLDARREIRSVDDLILLGGLDRDEWASRPLRDLVPRSVWARRRELIVAESGGTSGPPSRTVFSRAEFEAAFGAPFAAVSARRGFPRDGSWLFVGPSGPHVIARASRLLARLHGAAEPFTVDLDPRWARAQEPGSLGARLYTRHVVEQALDVLDREPVDTLFVTPPLALALAGELDEDARRGIRGIHLGGMAFAAGDRACLASAFPEAVILPGYGNSMFGLMIEAEAPGPDGAHVDYFPLPGRLLVRVVPEDEHGPVLDREVAVGERGRVVMSRLDETFLVVDHVERDHATRIAAPEAVQALGLALHGLRDPYPVVVEQATGGLY